MSRLTRSRTGGGIMRLLLLLALLPSAAEGLVMALSSMYGSLESPNFPEPYPQQLELVWDIRVQTGFRIRLDFSHFHLEPSYQCEYDQVQVLAEGEILGLFCGSESTDTETVPGDKSIRSPSNSLTVTFRSDYSDEERYTGFRGHYTAEDIDECVELLDEDLVCDHFCHNYVGGFYCSCRHSYQLHQDNRTCSVHCRDSVFEERSGTLQSPDFPGPYPKSSDCSYRIQVQSGFRVSLQFDSVFDVEDHPEATCPYDYVKILAGSQEFGPFCGTQSPGLIETGASSVIIEFHSDNSGENQGWRLNYTAKGSICPTPDTPLHAVRTPIQSEYSFTDHVLFTCQEGYRFYQDGLQQQHFQISCLSNGSWSSSVPICQMLDCGVPPTVAQAQLLYTDPGNITTYGSRIQYLCEDQDQDQSKNQTSNHSLAEFLCGADGEWTNPETGNRLPTCPLGCGVSRSLPALVKRIVGGRVAEPGMFPWQVLITVVDQTRIPEQTWFGSGSLLSDSWVLTAAHVLRSVRRDGSVVPIESQGVQVYLGLHSSGLKQQSQKRTVDVVVLHPEFQPQNYNNDIALLKLSNPAPISEVIHPVCLPPIRSKADPPLPEPHSLGVVAGWGMSGTSINASSMPGPTSSPPDPVPSPASPAPSPLRYVRLPVVTQSECRESYASRSGSYYISDAMFCAGFERGGHDTCLGDSGGGFVMQEGRGQRWTVLGVVSWAGPEECGTERVYGVYTRVENYRDWIIKTMD